LRETVSPVFDAVGSRTIWVGGMPGDGQRLKLVANSFVLSLVGSTAQALDLTRRLGLDPKLFLDTIAGGPLDIPYVQMKGKSMIAGEFPPAFPLAGATKDGYLILEAMEHAGSRAEIMQALVGRYQEAVDGDHGAEDLAAVITAFGS
jgi:3-hydroxyisobutyrate dehydrogenase